MKVAFCSYLPFIVTSILIFPTAAYGYSKHRATAVSVCDVISNPEKYDKHQIIITAELVLEPHAGHLFGSQCSAKGSIRLIINEKVGEDPHVIAMIRRIMRHHARGHVTLAGAFDKTPVDTFNGSFFLSYMPDIFK